MAEITLTRELYDQLKRDERSLLELLPQCDKLEACKIDSGSYRAVIQSLLADIKAVEDQFATPPPK